MSVKIISINVRGLSNKNKCRSIFKYYRDRCDILCLQETHSIEETNNIWKNEWGGWLSLQMEHQTPEVWPC